MKLLHRHLLSELLYNGALTLAAILGLYFILALTFTLGTSRAEGVPIWLILRYAAYSVVSTFYLILPLTILTASIFTYGRSSSEGEFTALRVAGIHPYQALVPALAVGACAMLVLVALQDRVMPESGFRARLQLAGDIFMNLEEILNRSEMHIEEKRWKATWQGRAVDEGGHTVLAGLTVIELDRDDAIRAETKARVARPVFDETKHTLELTLKDVVRTELERPGREDAPPRFWSAGEYTMTLDLEALSEGQGKRPRDKNRSYEELITKARRLAERAEGAATPRQRQAAAENRREVLSILHFRLAFAFSAAVFAVFGAALGLVKAIGSRALVFLVGFLILIAGYYPLVMLGKSLGESGALPVVPALWGGNLVLVVLAALLYRRVARA